MRIARAIGRDEFAFADGAINLAAIGVAPDADVDGSEADLLRIFDLSGQENGSGAGAECRFEPRELLQFFESGLAQEFEESAGFAAGNDQTVELIQLLGPFHEHNLGTQLFEPAAVGVEISLQGQDTDDHFSRWSLVVRR